MSRFAPPATRTGMNGAPRPWPYVFAALAAVVGACGGESIDVLEGASGGAAGADTGCRSPADCPASNEPCTEVTCTARICGQVPTPKGTVVSTDVACKISVCDGSGAVLVVVDQTRVPIVTSVCTLGTCDASGLVSTKSAEKGSVCASILGGTRCDGAGNCVECLEDDDCVSGQSCTSAQRCVATPCTDCDSPDGCSNGAIDGGETDLDCGGECPPCATNRACKLDDDCVSHACDAVTSTCDPSACSDRHLDGVESDLDCGGGCAGCGLGRHCHADDDCASLACDFTSGACVADGCHDGRKDGSESDLDCGGSCDGCALNAACASAADCASNACELSARACVASPCHDGVADDGESDTDCGGPKCVGCDVDQKCVTDDDCASSACDAISQTCVSKQCIDHHIDGKESDVDCGGGTCDPCPVGEMCNTSFDCVSDGLGCSIAEPHVCE